MSRQVSPEGSYRDKLVKLIPTEVIGAFVAIQSFVGHESHDEESNVILWVSFSILLLSIPFYLRFFYRVFDRRQIACTMFAFSIWSYSMGGLSHGGLPYDGRIASVGLVLWTTLVPLFVRRKTKICAGDTVQITEKRPSADIQREAFCVAWDKQMSKYCSETAIVRKIDEKKMTALLDIDGETHEWAFEWLIVIKE